MKKKTTFLFEVGMLKKTPRSGYQFLGSGGESVADHSFRTAIIAYVLASETDDVNREKVVLMSLFHDLAETRTGDQNYVNKRYVEVDEESALRDQVRGLVFGDQIMALTEEFNRAETLEARLTRDADQLDLILELKEQLDLGNAYARDWLHYAVQRLTTKNGKDLAKEILETDSADWWFEKKTERWVNGPFNKRKAE
ncbi:MAG: HD domain-containing protein [Desulfatiglans sp.]|jgi:putative hydrolase of HD superfamily|nr:HD domain-containing protein [Desulfatiglans sp.]